MDKQTENEIRKKVLRGAELTEQEKRQMGMDYDEWKQMHEESQESLLETYWWGSWPMLFICGFFLLSAAVNNTRYLMNGGQPDASVIAVAAAGWILGLASVIMSFWMKKVSRQKQMLRAQRAQERSEREALMKASENSQSGRAASEETFEVQTGEDESEETESVNSGG